MRRQKPKPYRMDDLFSGKPDGPDIHELIGFVLEECRPFHKVDAKWVADRIQRQARLYEDTVFSGEKVEITEGPCLGCQKQTLYRDPTQYHRRFGDAWLTNLWRMVQESKEIHFDHRSLYTDSRTFGMSYVYAYFCRTCRGMIDTDRREERIAEREASKLRHEQERLRAAERERKAAQLAIQTIGGNAVLIGRKVSRDEAGPLLVRFQSLSDGERQQLRQMPYRDFLQTVFWKVVRQIVLLKGRYQCALCSSRAALEVHHKTYEHHGAEDLHIEDLTILCHKCHDRHSVAMPQIAIQEAADA